MHQLLHTLIELGLSKKETLVSFYPTTRDNEEVGVLKCTQSGVFVLNKLEHMSPNYYTKAKNEALWKIGDLQIALAASEMDNSRRKAKYQEMIIGKKYLDFGAGAGGILKTFKPYAKEIFGVELQENIVSILQAEGFKMANNIRQFPHSDFEVVSLFHVAEHLTDPIETLKEIKDQMKPGGKIIIEVPHAGDALIGLYHCEAFKKFTFWSQHIILHTRQSLEKFVLAAGFKNLITEGVQRYPLSNHLYWLTQGKPGGHKEWPFLNQKLLIEAYAQALQSVDCTDTLVLIAEK